MQEEVDPVDHGWTVSTVPGVPFTPITTLNAAAPAALLELVKCNCKSSKCATRRCSCRSNSLTCTPLCNCEDCGNQEPDHVVVGEELEDLDFDVEDTY